MHISLLGGLDGESPCLARFRSPWPGRALRRADYVNFVRYDVYGIRAFSGVLRIISYPGANWPLAIVAGSAVTHGRIGEEDQAGAVHRRREPGDCGGRPPQAGSSAIIGSRG